MVNKARLESIRKRNAVAFEKVQDARMKLREWLGDMRLIAHEQRFLDVRNHIILWTESLYVSTAANSSTRP